MSNFNRKYAQIWLPYFKQGDDMNGCIVKDENDCVDVKASIRNHINLLESAIDQLKSIHDAIPDINTCRINADTHYIGIEGDERIINILNENGLVSISDHEEEEYGFDDDLNNLSDDDLSSDFSS